MPQINEAGRPTQRIAQNRTIWKAELHPQGPNISICMAIISTHHTDTWILFPRGEHVFTQICVTLPVHTPFNRVSEMQSHYVNNNWLHAVIAY